MPEAMTPKTTPEHPLFTVITCTWNSIATLPDTIASVLAQQDVRVEHVFVDGGSTDGTLEMISERSPNAVVLKNVSGGISKAMNAGIDAASGDIVSHLHSDDYYIHAHVLKRVAMLFARPGCQWVVGKTHTLIDGRLRPGADLGAFSTRKYRSRGSYLPHPSTFMSRTLMRKIGYFDDRHRYAMDLDYWLRALRCAEPVVTEEPLAIFREHSGSLSSANRQATRMDEWAVRTKYALDDIPASILMQVRMVQHVLRSLVREAFESRRFDAGTAR